MQQRIAQSMKSVTGTNDGRVPLANHGLQGSSLRRCAVGICVIALALGALVFAPTAFSEEDETAGLTELLRKDPDNVDLLKQRAIILRQEQRYSESLSDLNRARLLNPDDPEIGLIRALTLSALRRDQDAEVELEIFIRVGNGPLQAIALAERGYIRARTLRQALAVTDFTAAIAIRPALDLYLARGRLQESLGQLGAAAAGYQDAIASLGRATALTSALIRLQIQRGQLQSARPLIDQELTRSRVKTLWLVRRAEVRAATGQSAEALADLRTALAEANRILDRKVTAIHLLSRAKVLIAMGRIEEARSDLEGCIGLAPAFVDCRTLLNNL
ncbi:MAG: hypothetical protein WCH75_01590 [Candidatus Binatia bacterium]